MNYLKKLEIIFFIQKQSTLFLVKKKKFLFKFGDEKAIAQSKSSNDDLVFDTSKANWYAYDVKLWNERRKKIRYVYRTIYYPIKE